MKTKEERGGNAGEERQNDRDVRAHTFPDGTVPRRQDGGDIRLIAVRAAVEPLPHLGINA